MAIGQVRVWFPDGRAHVVPLLEDPKHGAELVALGVRKHWIVADVRASEKVDLLYDVWVEDARSG